MLCSQRHQHIQARVKLFCGWSAALRLFALLNVNINSYIVVVVLSFCSTTISEGFVLTQLHVRICIDTHTHTQTQTTGVVRGKDTCHRFAGASVLNAMCIMMLDDHLLDIC